MLGTGAHGGFDGGDVALGIDRKIARCGCEPPEAQRPARAPRSAPVINEQHLCSGCADKASRAVHRCRRDAQEWHEGAPPQILVKRIPDASARLQISQQRARIIAIDQGPEAARAAAIAQAVQGCAPALALNDVDIGDRAEAGSGDLERDLMAAKEEDTFRRSHGRLQFVFSDHVQATGKRSAIPCPSNSALQHGGAGGGKVFAKQARPSRGAQVRKAELEIAQSYSATRRCQARAEMTERGAKDREQRQRQGRDCACEKAQGVVGRGAMLWCSRLRHPAREPMVALPDLSAVHVVVCGDVMLDRYFTGATGRISPEAPVPVVRVDAEVLRPGGAANVAAGIVALGARCTLIGVVGDDADGGQLERLLREVGVECRLQRDPQRRTVTKLRVTSRGQQLLRLDFEDDQIAAPAIDPRRVLVDVLDDADALVLSDYAKGTLFDPEGLVAEARARNVPVVVDPKRGPFSRFRGAQVLKPNLQEFVAASGGGLVADDADLAARARALREASGVEALLLTRGAAGMSLFTDYGRQDLAAEAREVFDVTGAGDTVAAVLAAALAGGAPLESAVELANRAAGIAVAQTGTRPVSRGELSSPGTDDAVIARDVLLARVAEARAVGERVVFTNGCFDLLHAGHVAYLQEAAALGDRLIVAINDDASVRRLKGEDRPYVSAVDRARVLAGLRGVDWVTVFEDDTPEALIEHIAPDVLVKGGDYRLDAVVGGEVVRRQGGEVRVLGLQPGRSTTALAARVRKEGA